MKNKFKFTWRIWLLIVLLALSFLAIFSSTGLTQSGVVIDSIDLNSSLLDQGMTKGEIITSIDGLTVDSIESFSLILSQKYLTGKKVKTTFVTDKNEYIIFSSEVPKITVKELSKTNIQLGLDLAGGARAMVKAENHSLNQEELNDLVEITRNRLNAFGLTDLKVLSVSDLSGNNFMLIEIAGSTPRDLKKLLSEQGKFEARIGNETVFLGGDRDVASVGRDAQNSRIESCNPAQDGTYYCNFQFSITLSPEAAQRHADITDKLSVNVTEQGNYLSEKLDLVLDGNLVDSLLISEGLKGRVTTQISISGSGSGTSEEEAYNTAKAEMKQMQTVLMTGSLPFKLEIVKLDTISPILGEGFVKIILIAGLAAILAVALIIFVRYRSPKAAIALLVTTISEVIIILGAAALIRWNLDLPGIAGILATIGTGIDDLIIIMDESTTETRISLKQRLKRAFAIIMGAYATSMVALFPLFMAGAGLLKGFAVTTMLGITIGVLITRPAFSDIIKQFRK
jgi:preprotein translocase subunit SecD